MYYHPDKKSYDKVKVTNHGGANFLAPKSYHHGMLEAYSDGGPVIANVDAGLTGYVWHAYVEGDKVYLNREDTPTAEPQVLLTRAGITQIDLTFDQTMRPFLAFVASGKPYYLSFSGDTSTYTTVKLPDTVVSPRCEIDYRDILDIPRSDIILGYTNAGNLCYRLQRERFLKEHKIAKDPKKTLLWRIGRLTDGRFGYLWR